MAGESTTLTKAFESRAVRAARPTRPLRILNVTARYLPSIGGTEIHTAEVARRLAAWGNDVTILTTDSTGDRVGHEDAAGVSVVRTRAWPRDRDWYASPAVYSYVMDARWDVIHCQGYHTLVAPAAMLAAVRSRQPFVVTFHSGGHSSPVRRAGRPVQRTLLRPLLNHAEYLIGVSATESQFFADRLRIPSDRFLTIPNGVSLPYVEADDRARARPVIASVGRLERYKGHHRAILALPYLLGRKPDVLLRVVGAGPYEATLRDLAHQLGVDNAVEFLSVDPSDRSRLATILAESSLVVILSSYESHGLAAQEAISLGRPVLVADAGALSEFVESGNARGVPTRCTPEHLAQVMHHGLVNPLVPAPASVPSWDDVAEDLLELYQSVVASS